MQKNWRKPKRTMTSRFNPETSLWSVKAFSRTKFMHTTRDSNVDYSSQGNRSGDGLDIGTWIGYLWEKKWIFIWSALVCGLIGTILSFTLTRMYTATATVLVEDPPNVIPGQNNGVKDVYSAPEALKAV